MPTEIQPVLIAGASVRAAAGSARRAGLVPWCVDLFADMDLARACPARVIDDYPASFPAALAEGPIGPWLYTGALENHPAIIAAVPRPLWGNPGNVVRAVRDPFLLAATFSAAGVAVPRLSRDAMVEGRWLCKPRRGAAGHGIRPHSPGERVPRGHYLQEWIDGEPASALFLGRSDGSCASLGTTRQIIGADWLHVPRPFAYAGSIGPLELTATEDEELQRLGKVLTEKLRLLGLFGVDFILREGGVYAVEVNPRYTASVEIIERLTGRPLLRDHADCFVGKATDASAATARQAGSLRYDSRCCGKAILFAGQDIVVKEHGPWEAAADYTLDDLRLPFGDLPRAGQRIARGQPVLTFFASGESPRACEQALREIAADLDRALYGR